MFNSYEFPQFYHQKISYMNQIIIHFCWWTNIPLSEYPFLINELLGPEKYVVKPRLFISNVWERNTFNPYIPFAFVPATIISLTYNKRRAIPLGECWKEVNKHITQRKSDISYNITEPTITSTRDLLQVIQWSFKRKRKELEIYPIGSAIYIVSFKLQWRRAFLLPIWKIDQWLIV